MRRFPWGMGKRWPDDVPGAASGWGSADRVARGVAREDVLTNPSRRARVASTVETAAAKRAPSCSLTRMRPFFSAAQPGSTARLRARGGRQRRWKAAGPSRLGKRGRLHVHDGAIDRAVEFVRNGDRVRSGGGERQDKVGAEGRPVERMREEAIPAGGPEKPTAERSVALHLMERMPGKPLRIERMSEVWSQCPKRGKSRAIVDIPQLVGPAIRPLSLGALRDERSDVPGKTGGRFCREIDGAADLVGAGPGLTSDSKVMRKALRGRAGALPMYHGRLDAWVDVTDACGGRPTADPPTSQPLDRDGYHHPNRSCRRSLASPRPARRGSLGRSAVVLP